MKTLLFDFDGTIADSYSIGLSVFNALANRFNKPDLSRYTDDQIRMMDARGILKALSIRWYQLPRYVRLARKDINSLIDEINIFPEVASAILELKDHYKIGVVSSNSKDNIVSVLSRCNLNMFDFIHSGTSLFGKSRVINKIMRNYQLSKSDVLYIADEPRDITAAKKSGIPILAVTWGYNHSDLLSAFNPDFILEEQSALKSTIFSVFPA